MTNRVTNPDDTQEEASMTISLRSVIEAGHDPLAFIGIDDEPHEHLGDLLRMATETANSASA